MLISQFMGRLARANRADKTHHKKKTETDRNGQTQDTGVISLIQFYCIQTFIQGNV
jgi:hypothetical protein